MNYRLLRHILWGALIVVALATIYPVYLETHKVEIAKQSQLASLFEGWEGSPDLGEQVKFSDCRAKEPLPDPDCTPGAIFPDVTKDEICVSGYSKTVRNVPVSLKKKVFALYGISYPVPFGSYEVDHLIPLALGGSNDISNLWPKSAEPFPGFYEKDIVGNYLHEEVCAGRFDLSAAQEIIATDWFLIYNSLNDNKIRELKSKYKNWADRELKN